VAECCEECGLEGKHIERPALTGSYFKVLVRHRGAVQEFLPAARTFVFGRGADVDAKVDDEMLSRRQARLVFENDGVYIEDLGSACGTRVDGELVQKAKLGAGATINFGNSHVRVEPL